MSIYRILTEEALTAPALIAAFDGWVDAGAAATTAASFMADGGDVVATFDADALIDYRARRPVLDIEDGVMQELTWSEITIRRVAVSGRDLLVLTGPEPDYRWQEFRSGLVEAAVRLGVVESVCMGAIPAMVPHTRPAPVLVTGKGRRPLDIDPPLPADHLRVPASAVNLVELYLAEHGIPSVGFWAQIPHYVAGTYHGGALALTERVAAHLGVHLSLEALVEQAKDERIRLDAIVAERPEARAYLDQLEADGPTPIQPVPPGEDLAAEVERFLRDTTGEDRNPFET